MSVSKFSYFTIFCLASMKDPNGGLCSLPRPTHFLTLCQLPLLLHWSHHTQTRQFTFLVPLHSPHTHIEPPGLLGPLSTGRILLILLRLDWFPPLSETFASPSCHLPVMVGLSHTPVLEHVPHLSHFLSWGISSVRPKLIRLVWHPQAYYKSKEFWFFFFLYFFPDGKIIHVHFRQFRKYKIVRKKKKYL